VAFEFSGLYDIFLFGLGIWWIARALDRQRSGAFRFGRRSVAGKIKAGWFSLRFLPPPASTVLPQIRIAQTQTTDHWWPQLPV